jgi:hypothetical protein
MQMLSEKGYYETMSSFKSNMKFAEVHEKWYKCFYWILKSFKVGYTDKIIYDLFYHFSMENWSDLNKDQTEFKNNTPKELLRHFCGECAHICDRAGYDRLFRTHWLFLNAFQKQMWNLRKEDRMK